MAKKFTLSIVFASLVSLSFYGCGKNEPGSPQLSQMNEQDFAKIHKGVEFNKDDKEKVHGMGMASEGGHGMGAQAKKEKADPTKVIATVNGEKILRGDLDKILDRFRNQINPSAIPSLEQQITNQLITQSVLRQFVVDNKLAVSNDVVEKEINKMRDNIKNNPATKDRTLEQFLELQGSNVEELKTAINMSAAIENYVSKDIDEKKQEEYFIKNISSFSGETVTASHILVDTKDTKSQEDLDKAKTKIESIKKELDEGADFAELAKKYSDCPTGKTGGDLGAFPRHGAMVEPFAAAAFAMEAGKISEPVKTEFGYHLIKVTAHTPAKNINYSEVKDRVREEMVAKEMNNLIQDLREKAKVEITL